MLSIALIPLMLSQAVIGDLSYHGEPTEFERQTLYVKFGILGAMNGSVVDKARVSIDEGGELREIKSIALGAGLSLGITAAYLHLGKPSRASVQFAEGAVAYGWVTGLSLVDLAGLDSRWGAYGSIALAAGGLAAGTWLELPISASPGRINTITTLGMLGLLGGLAAPAPNSNWTLRMLVGTHIGIASGFGLAYIHDPSVMQVDIASAVAIGVGLFGVSGAFADDQTATQAWTAYAKGMGLSAISFAAVYWFYDKGPLNAFAQADTTEATVQTSWLKPAFIPTQNSKGQHSVAYGFDIVRGRF